MLEGEPGQLKPQQVKACGIALRQGRHTVVVRSADEDLPLGNR
jgi:hypothetical protein